MQKCTNKTNTSLLCNDFFTFELFMPNNISQNNNPQTVVEVSHYVVLFGNFNGFQDKPPILFHLLYIMDDIVCEYEIVYYVAVVL